MAQTTEARRSGSFPGWRVLVAATVANWVNLALYLVGLGPSTIPLQEEFGWSRTFVAGAYSTAGLLGFVSPLFGYGVDRFGPRLMMLAGAVSSSSGALMLAMTDSSGILWYVGWIFLMGPTGVWLSYPTTNKVISNWFLRRRGIAMGLLALAGAFSYIMAAVHGLLINAVGWRGNWLILAAASFVIYLVTIILFVRNTPEEMGWHQDGVPMTPEERAAWAANRGRRAEPTAAARPAAQPTEYQFTIWQALRSPSAWLIFLAGFGANVALQIQTTQQVPFLEGMGVDRVVAGTVLGAMGPVRRARALHRRLAH